ncbi:MAG: hypothetical protein WDO73_13740 [Ignavibacteriota bacterium]
MEHKWTAEDFWRALARKCLLPPRSWHDPDARIEIFEAQVFGRPPGGVVSSASRRVCTVPAQAPAEHKWIAGDFLCALARKCLLIEIQESGVLARRQAE